MSMTIYLQCKRCLCKYVLNPGRKLSSYCGPCYRILGRKEMTDFDRWGLNARYGQSKEHMNAGGGPRIDPLKKYLILQGDKK